jgi:IS605 OrfB family transposase
MQQMPLFSDSTGIDLGLKDFAATSDGAVIEAQHFYRGMEQKLAIAQRANKKDRVKAVHARIAYRRKDFHHKLSTRLVASYGAIFVGNVNASALARTNQAKSVLDAGWSAFRTMLQYKCDSAGVWFDEVDEAYSTQTCSCCNKRTGPKGLEGLRIREWTCSECETAHHRDVNASINILAAGHGRLAGGIPVLTAQAAALQG